eukprot:CAMPEP_0172529968 /NCGR_PEP_ID=MMETSP1067-20121228/3874_1 /TAXON_ID=265564 ORGANISM="Thalassiosira punctigera, Strain Tpunct2005C2" /NCGR_SAMPLE_ID=MMETSP1067 /ASSEMBLY_ACC=CAM_ASM_000444 /LENGTH=303 /DNA_ID=CAMNT_0013314107 /DNA_START=123 /DNA_END=1034 /DNA_ORIENTATION=+
MMMSPACRSTTARGIVACLKRNKSACAAAAGPSMLVHEPEAEAREKFLERFERDDSLREHVAYSLSFAGDSSLESDFESDDTFPLLDDRMKRQLRASYDALLSPSDKDAQKLRSRLPPQLDLCKLELEALAFGERIKRKLPPLMEPDDEEISAARYPRPLPKYTSDISSSKLDEDARAIVITDTKNPYRVVAVNTAWENLCEYTLEECKGRSLGRLLHGPETDLSPVAAMIGKLLQGEECRGILTNYTKHGRKFRNNLRVGPIFDEMGKTVNFVGILREVEDYQGNLKNVEGDRGRSQLPFMS